MSKKNEARTVRVVATPQGKGYVPGVRLAGQYLKNLGFNMGDTVVITPVGDGSLNIRRVAP